MVTGASSRPAGRIVRRRHRAQRDELLEEAQLLRRCGRRTGMLAGDDGVSASAASSFDPPGCVSVSGTTYSNYTSVTNSFAAHAMAVGEASTTAPPAR